MTRFWFWCAWCRRPAEHVAIFDELDPWHGIEIRVRCHGHEHDLNRTVEQIEVHDTLSRPLLPAAVFIPPMRVDCQP